jgi:hypothetical protein
LGSLLINIAVTTLSSDTWKFQLQHILIE